MNTKKQPLITTLTSEELNKLEMDIRKNIGCQILGTSDNSSKNNVVNELLYQHMYNHVLYGDVRPISSTSTCARESQWESELLNNMGIRTAISFCIKKVIPEYFPTDKEKLENICKLIFLMIEDYIVVAANKHGWHTVSTAAHICIFIKEKQTDIIRKILNEST